jgi:hypothetical protein
VSQYDSQDELANLDTTFGFKLVTGINFGRGSPGQMGITQLMGREMSIIPRTRPVISMSTILRQSTHLRSRLTMQQLAITGLSRVALPGALTPSLEGERLEP